jgi:hypothetical protein
MIVAPTEVKIRAINPQLLNPDMLGAHSQMLVTTWDHSKASLTSKGMDPVTGRRLSVSMYSKREKGRRAHHGIGANQFTILTGHMWAQPLIKVRGTGKYRGVGTLQFSGSRSWLDPDEDKRAAQKPRLTAAGKAGVVSKWFTLLGINKQKEREIAATAGARFVDELALSVETKTLHGEM